MCELDSSLALRSPDTEYSDTGRTEQSNGNVRGRRRIIEVSLDPRQATLNPYGKRKTVNQNSLGPTIWRRVYEVRRDVRERKHNEPETEARNEPHPPAEPADFITKSCDFLPDLCVRIVHTKSGLTSNITGAAPVVINMKQKRHRRVRCMCMLASITSMIPNVRASLNDFVNLQAATATTIKIYNFPSRLIAVRVVTLDKLNSLFVTSGASPRVRRVLLGIRCRIFDGKLFTTQRTVILGRLHARLAGRLDLIRSTASADDGV